MASSTEESSTFRSPPIPADSSRSQSAGTASSAASFFFRFFFSDFLSTISPSSWSLLPRGTVGGVSIRTMRLPEAGKSGSDMPSLSSSSPSSQSDICSRLFLLLTSPTSSSSLPKISSSFLFRRGDFLLPAVAVAVAVVVVVGVTVVVSVVGVVGVVGVVVEEAAAGRFASFMTAASGDFFESVTRRSFSSAGESFVSE